MCGGSAFYCPEGSVQPVLVDPGFYSVGGASDTTRTGQEACEPGHYCQGGIKQECGSAAVYCVAKASAPSSVQTGYYSTGGTSNTTRTGESQCEPDFFCVNGVKQPCPDGKFATEAGSVQCSALANGLYLDVNGNAQPCEPGYYCQNGAKNDCGSPNLICPDSSMISPNVVQTGYYSSGGTSNTTRTEERECEVGHFCVNGIRFVCALGYFADRRGAVSCKAAERGFYSNEPAVQESCSPGTFTENAGLSVCSRCEVGR